MSLQLATAFWLDMHRSFAAAHESLANVGDAIALSRCRASFQMHYNLLLRCFTVLSAGSGGQGCYRGSPGSGSESAAAAPGRSSSPPGVAPAASQPLY